MKKLIPFVLSVLSTITVFAQQKMPCCTEKAAPTATRRFAMLSNDKNFRTVHKIPGKINYHAEGQMITFKTSDGKPGSAYMLKAEKPTNNYILIIHEWWGLNDYVKRESDKIFHDLGNVNILALDLYDGQVTTSREEAGKLTQNTKEERITAIIKGAAAYAGTNAHIATLGWCYGGAWSLQAGIILGKQAAGVVMYYGMPEQDLNRLKLLQTAVLGVFANQDGWIGPKVAEKFATDMKRVGKTLYMHQYEAEHGFANPSNDIYNDAATNDAYKKTLTFLRARLK